MSTVRVGIELGNAAMRSSADVAAALRRLAAQIEDERAVEALLDPDLPPASGPQRLGLIRDANGNTVGQATLGG